MVRSVHLVLTVFFIVVLLARAESLGIHTPIPITPTLSVGNARWLLDAYETVLAREADSAGFRVNFQDLESGADSRQGIYDAFVDSAEFQDNVAVLGNRSGFITRCYQTLLLRDPAESEVNNYLAVLQTYNGQAGTLSWLELIEAFYASSEYFGRRCQTGYYTLNAPVDESALLLRDIWASQAILQTPGNGSEPISLTIPSATTIWDQKLPTIVDPESVSNISLLTRRKPVGPEFVHRGIKNPRLSDNSTARHIAFTRAFNGQQFTITLLESWDDGLSFSEVDVLWPIEGSNTFYDAHLSVDNSVCPPMYTLAMECATPQSSGAASLCVSQSPTPGRAYTWSYPQLIVNGCAGNDVPASCGTMAAESASTGVILMDNGGANKYLSWTQVYDGVGPNDPQVHTYSQMAGPVASVRSFFGTVMSPAALTMMSSEPHPWCTDAWDCNNRDKQDWKREGDYVYALYNGANYYRCNGRWGISISRSSTADSSGEYQRLTSRGDVPLIWAALNNTCGISYPVLNIIAGQLYVYFAYRDDNGAPVMMRSRVVAA